MLSADRISGLPRRGRRAGRTLSVEAIALDTVRLHTVQLVWANVCLVMLLSVCPLMRSFPRDSAYHGKNSDMELALCMTYDTDNVGNERYRICFDNNSFKN